MIHKRSPALERSVKIFLLSKLLWKYVQPIDPVSAHKINVKPTLITRRDFDPLPFTLWEKF